MILFLFLFIINCYSIIDKVSYEEFTKDSICGDGIFDKYTEECDGVRGCNSKCECQKGYKSDGKGNCIIDCIFGDKCLSGCREPNICELCDTTKGYTKDCQQCKDDYIWYGSKNCSSVEGLAIESCASFFKQFETYNQTQHLDKFYIDMAKYYDFNTTVRTSRNYANYMVIARCSPFVDVVKPYTFGSWFKINFEPGHRVAIELKERLTMQDRKFIDDMDMIA